MTGRELYLKTKSLFDTCGGERFFSFSLLWAALREKRSLDGSVALSEKDVPEADGVINDAMILCEGEPIQYYLGHWEFCGHDFLCRPNVLIPREDTKILVRLCAGILPENGTLLDLCCGSGCVGIAALLSRPDCYCAAADISREALALTVENASRLGVSDRFSAFRLDLLKEDPPFDADVYACNPPYIPSGDIRSLPENVKREPRIALDGGGDGLDFYRRLKVLADKTGKPFVCEIGFDQKESVKEIFGGETEFFKDEGGRDRAFVYRAGCAIQT